MTNYMNPNDNVAKYYHSLLLEQIITFQEDEIDKHTKYIAALSKYICKGSMAYQYNLTYWVSQNEEFCRFLRCANKKYRDMEVLLRRVYAIAAVQEFLRRKLQKCEKVTIIFNNFLEGDIGGCIHLAEDFSISGAEWRSTNDVFTVCHGERRRSASVTVDTDTLEKLVQAVLKIPRQEE